jgi:hypothetical protein
MQKKLMMKLSVVLLVLLTIFLIIGVVGNNNTAKLIGFVLLCLSTILNIFIRFKR